MHRPFALEKRVICKAIVNIFDDTYSAGSRARLNRIRLPQCTQVAYLQPCTAPIPPRSSSLTHPASMASPQTGTSRRHPSCAGSGVRWRSALRAPSTGARPRTSSCRPARRRRGSCTSCLRRTASCSRRTALRWRGCAKKACRSSWCAAVRTNPGCRPICRPCAMRCCGKRRQATIFRRTRWRCAISAAARRAPTSSSRTIRYSARSYRCAPCWTTAAGS